MKKIIAMVCTTAFLLAGVVGCAADSATEMPSAPIEQEASPTVSAQEEVPEQKDVEENTAVETEVASGSPESVIEEFIGAIVRGQDAMAQGEVLDTFAFEEYVAGYDEEKMKEYLGKDLPEEMLPPKLTEEIREDELTKSVSAFLIGFWMDLENDGLTAEQDVINDVSSYAGLTVKRIDTPKPNMLKNVEEVDQKWASIYGAQDVAIRTALLELDGKTYYCGFTLFLYGDNWKIKELSAGAVMGTSPNLATFPLLEEEYLKMIADTE